MFRPTLTPGKGRWLREEGAVEYLFAIGFIAVVFGVITLVTDGVFDLPDLE